MDSSADRPTPPSRSNLTLWLILAVCVFPFIASVALYLFWRPQSFVNYGELLEPVALSGTTLAQRGGDAFRLDDLRGQWVLLTVDAGACDEHCLRKLYWMRQVRLAQGADQERIERVWLVSDAAQPPSEVAAAHTGLRQIALADPAFLERLPAAGAVSDHLYVIDPFGNLMMRYPRELDPSKMKKDLSRLLRISKGWRQIPG